MQTHSHLGVRSLLSFVMCYGTEGGGLRDRALGDTQLPSPRGRRDPIIVMLQITLSYNAQLRAAMPPTPHTHTKVPHTQRSPCC